MVHVGIDIGTSNTVVAIVGDDDTPVVRTINGDELLPSVIAVYEQGGNVVAGRDAVDAWADPEFDTRDTFRRWKLLMGEEKTFRTMRFGGASSDQTDITPEWLTTRLVEYALGQVADGVGGETIESVLITVPHGWRRATPVKCRATRDAAAAAVVGGKRIRVQDTTISEPVAAAAYCLWATQRSAGTSRPPFAGQHILVCDVGGGTLDLSLVLVGSVAGEALTVVDAINNNFAGDFVTALLMGRAARQFNEQHGTVHPTDPDEILALLGDAPAPHLRTWFVQLQQMQRDTSAKIAHAARMNKEARQKSTPIVLVDDGGRHITVSWTPAEFTETLAPFYERGRDLVSTFLSGKSQERPCAVVFAGGGSRIAGVPERIVGDALRQLRIADVDAILGRIKINEYRVDQAIALGAALVADGLVSVEERLLCDVGLEVVVGDDVADHLGVSIDDTVLMTPVLPKGSKLPVTFNSDDFQFFVYTPGGETLELAVVIDDDPTDPWRQQWEEHIPASLQDDRCSIVISADAEGVLDVRLTYDDGTQTSVRGTLSRERTGRTRILITGQERTAAIPVYRKRVTPNQFMEALQSTRRGVR